MEPALHRLLMAADDAKGCEFPMENAIPFELMDERVRILQMTLRRELSLDMHRDGCVQDASFFGELAIEDPRLHLNRIMIRLSNFGSLATVTTMLDRIPPEYDVAAITAMLEHLDWTVVEAEPLSALYDGPNAVLRKSKITWWERFFDYL